jgi:hypothetical protein
VGDIVTTTGPAAPGTMGPQGPIGLKGDPGGWTLGTILAATTDLNGVVTSGLYRIEGAPNTGLNWPIIASGVLHVEQRSTTNFVLQEYTPLWATNSVNGTTFYRRWMLNGVWSAWRTYVSTRVDQTAGRVMYSWDEANNRDQLVYGDTGERDIRTAYGNGTFAALKLRRFGNLVFLTCVGWTPPANSTANLLLGTLPVGFRNNNTLAIVALENGSTFKACTIGANTSSIAIGGNLAAAQYNFHTSWLTVDSWPTALPGDVSTAPPAS